MKTKGNCKLYAEHIRRKYGCISLTTLLVKHYNDLIDRRSYGRGRDEVFFCINLGTTYANFQEKYSLKRQGKCSKHFITVMLSIMYLL